MVSSKPRRCFLSYPLGDATADRVIREAVLPAVRDVAWVLVDPGQLDIGGSIFESITRALREADLLIAILPKPNYNVLYELGLAHGWGKRTVLLSHAIEIVPFDVASRFPVLLYSHNPESFKTLRRNLLRSLQDLEHEPPSLADPGLERYIDPATTISLELFAARSEPALALGSAYQIVESLRKLEPLSEASLTELRLGSFGAWISASIESIVALAEKIVFFVPEWRLKNAQRLKVEAEAELLLAEAERTRAHADAIRRTSARKDAELVLNVLTSPTNGPSRLTIGDRLRIETNEDGTVVLGVPKRRRRRSA